MNDYKRLLQALKTEYHYARGHDPGIWSSYLLERKASRQCQAYVAAKEAATHDAPQTLVDVVLKTIRETYRRLV